MTRINTNVSSLVGRNNLQRANADLSQSLTRLSTGLRINTGKDDPAGLIASENLRSDITSIRKAITNTDRATQVIATADSALGQVSSLLNDIRGLVTESANDGALSDAQIAANQLQIDSSLEALNRIAQTTKFQGRNLLDGSLDFTTTAGSNFNQIGNLTIDQANLGATGSVSVGISVSAAATQAQVDVTGIPTANAAVTASNGTLTFSDAATQASGTFGIAGETFDVAALASGAVDGVAGNSLTIALVDDDNGNAAATAITDAEVSGTTLTITGDFSGDSNLTAGELASQVNAIVGSGGDGDVSFALASGGTAGTAVQTTTIDSQSYSGGADAADDVITISADAAGDFNRTITFAESGSDLGAGVVTANDTGTAIEILVDDDTDVTVADIAAAINGLSDFSASVTTTDGDGDYTNGGSAPTAVNVGATTAGAGSSGGITQDLVFELSGSNGSEVFNVTAGSSITDLVNQINGVSDATGVTATANGTTLELLSSDYGSDAFVDVEVLTEGSGTVNSGTFTTAIGAGSRTTGTDIAAKVNGADANGNGNQLSINTATLDLTIDSTAGFTGDIAFTITGGGALFQLGPDVVSNQQARLGITSVNTAGLGGVSGNLYQLQSGGTADLASDTSTAAKIVEEAIDQITSLRGRLGAFQRTTLDTNKNALNDTLSNLTEAESSIRDADFAVETAKLTRSQILVQSGTRVLAIANQNPQNVLSLLG